MAAMRRWVKRSRLIWISSWAGSVAAKVDNMSAIPTSLHRAGRVCGENDLDTIILEWSRNSTCFPLSLSGSNARQRRYKRKKLQDSIHIALFRNAAVELAGE